jgi:peptidoglycan hydrolase-like protein with peptidoglycan-binding domain
MNQSLDGLPLRLGAHGEPVRDLQQRLAAAGFDATTDAGTFGPDTDAAVRRFQQHRGIVADGICGRDTWSALIEAGYRLGDRLLYLRTPMLRGDDVGALQLRLGGLGFDAGRVDNIFGPDTERALKDFQRNTALTTDGVCGPDVLAAIERLGTMAQGPTSVAGARAGSPAHPAASGAGASWCEPRRPRRPRPIGGPSLQHRRLRSCWSTIRPVRAGPGRNDFRRRCSWGQPRPARPAERPTAVPGSSRSAAGTRHSPRPA